MRILASLCVALFALSGCASLVSKSNYGVSVQSSPSGVPFRVYDEEGTVVSSGVTPSIVTLAAGDGYFSKAHYKVEYRQGGRVQTQKITPSLDGWYIGNLLWGPVIGALGVLVIDPISGSMYRLPENVMTNFYSSNQYGGVRSFDGAEKSLTVASLDQIPADLRSQLEPIQP